MTSNHISYKSQPGDTLSKIAKKNNTTVEELMALNADKIKDANTIFTGQKIVLKDDSSQLNIEDNKSSLKTEEASLNLSNEKIFGYSVTENFFAKEEGAPKSYTDIPPKSSAIVLKVAEELLNQGISEGDSSYLSITKGKKHSWCADTVNYIYEKAYGYNPFGYRNAACDLKSCVSELKDWGSENDKFIQSSKVVEGKTFTDETKTSELISQMKPADIIIFDACSNVTVDGVSKTKTNSHTGIVKEVKDGKVYIYEGNANYYKTDKNGGYLKVKTTEEGKNGAQKIGELQEINLNDGFILKEYNLSELAKAGFSGYINMQ